MVVNMRESENNEKTNGSGRVRANERERERGNAFVFEVTLTCSVLEQIVGCEQSEGACVRIGGNGHVSIICREKG